MLSPIRNKDFRRLLALFSGLIAIAACETKGPNCYEPVAVSMESGFKKRDTVVTYDTVTRDPLVLLKKISVQYNDSVMGSAEMKTLDEDTVVRSVGFNVRALGVPFDQSRDSIRYTFRTDTASTVYDTITFYYSPTLHFISNNCGYTYFFNIEDVKHTTNMIDSFGYVNRNVTDASGNNVQFYFRKKF